MNTLQNELTSATTALNKMSHAIATTFTPMFQKMARDFYVFSEAWLNIAETMYLQYYRRLPGSLRTLRLRKKQRKMVLAWWEQYCGQMIEQVQFDPAVETLDRDEITGTPLDSRTRTAAEEADRVSLNWREGTIFPSDLHDFRCRCSIEPRRASVEVPTTYCFDCGQMVPIVDTWMKKADPNYALCEGCFRVAESAGRAKERTYES